MEGVTVCESTDFELLSKMAYESWHSAYDALLGAKQVDYMLDKFQSAAAMREQTSTGTPSQNGNQATALLRGNLIRGRGTRGIRRHEELSVLVGVDRHQIALADGPVYDRTRDAVDDLALDEALQRTRSEDRIEASDREHLLRGGRDLKRHALFGEALMSWDFDEEAQAYLPAPVREYPPVDYREVGRNG